MQEKKEKKALKVDKKIEKGGKKEKKAAAAAEAAAAAAEPAKAPAAPRVLRKGTLGVFAKPLADDELAKKLLKIVGAGAKVRGPPGHGLRPRYSRAWLAPAHAPARRMCCDGMATAYHDRFYIRARRDAKISTMLCRLRTPSVAAPPPQLASPNLRARPLG